MNAQTHASWVKSLTEGKPVRKFAVAEKAPAYDPLAHTATFIISTKTVDRDKDVLYPEGCNLTDYAKNPIVLYQHSSHEPGMPIGHALRTWVEDGMVKSTIKFDQYDPATGVGNKLAMEVESCVASGSLRATSVGFIAEQRAPNDQRPTRWGGFGYDVLKWLLLEWSIVKVPSNPDCVIDQKALEAFLDQEPSMSMPLTPAPAAPDTKGTNPEATPPTAAAMTALHENISEAQKLCKSIGEMHSSMKEMHKTAKDMHEVHAGLVEDHKGNNKTMKGQLDMMAKHIKDLADSSGVQSAVDEAEAAYRGELGTKMLAAEKILNDPASTREAKLAAADEIKKLQKLQKKSGKVLSATSRDFVVKAMAAHEVAYGHLKALLKSADDADMDDGDDDEDDDKAGDTEQVKAEKKTRRDAKAAKRAEKKAAADAAQLELDIKAEEKRVAELYAKAATGDAEAKKQVAEFEELVKKATAEADAKAQGKTNF